MKYVNLATVPKAVIVKMEKHIVGSGEEIDLQPNDIRVLGVNAQYFKPANQLLAKEDEPVVKKEVKAPVVEEHVVKEPVVEAVQEGEPKEEKKPRKKRGRKKKKES